MLPKTVSIVLFDWDGTLCDSGAAHLDSFQKTLAEFGITFTRDEFKAVYSPAWYRMYEAFHLPRSEWPQADRRWLHHYGSQTGKLLAGAAPAVVRLRAAGFRLGVVTGGNRERIERELIENGLRPDFPAVVCHEDVVQKKPHPEGIHKALATLGCSTHTCCYVGDTPDDILMGKDAGVFTVGIETEYVHRSRLEQAAPDVLIDSIAKLPAILGC